MNITEQQNHSGKSDPLDDKPPFLKKWYNIYMLVLLVLVVLIGLFYLFSISFR